jgi:pimeloyl-ACP methyl ester carboxylesterase
LARRRGGEELESFFHEVPGSGRVRALVAGEGTRPLVLVHGWPTCARTFWPLLTDPGLRSIFRMVAPDLFGFGRSALSADPLTFGDQVEAVLQVARDQRRPSLAVGVSFGARVLLQAASRAPALFRRILLLSPYLHPGLTGRSLFGRTLTVLPRPLRRAIYCPPLSVVTGLWAATSSLLARAPSLAAAWQASLLVGDVARMRPETVDLFRAFPDGRPLLHDLGVPVELWYGDRDELLDAAELAALAPRPGLRVVRVAGAGHALHESHTRALAAALLEDVEPGP